MSFNFQSSNMMGVDFVARCLAARKSGGGGKSEFSTFCPVVDLKYKNFTITADRPKQLEFDPLIQTFKCDLAYYFAGGNVTVDTPQRKYTKLNAYPAIGLFVTDGSYAIWLLISDRAEGVTVLNSYSADPLQYAKTIDYLGTTWYVSKSDYASSAGACSGYSATYPNNVTFVSNPNTISDDDVKAILDYVNAEVISQ